MPAIINVENLTKKFNGAAAVDGISFEVERGSIFGFLGPNGAGKTTTINILCTLLSPSSGTAVIDGHDCAKESSEVRKKIGIVFQDNTLDKELTAYENLLFHAYLYCVPGSVRKKKIDEALLFVDLHKRKDEPVKKFSGGMKRRLEVARSLIHQPGILFLDEPTLGLDPQSRTNLWEFIYRLPGEQGVTIFMTTHYMEEAEICGEIAIIDKGRLIARGSPDDLKKMAGGDIIYLKTLDNESSLRDIRTQLRLDAEETGDEILIPVDGNGETLIPKLIGALNNRVIAVRMHRPALNDVFLKLTGKDIRPEVISGNSEIKNTIRSYRRKFDK